MRAFILTAPGAYEVQELPAPVAAPGEVVVDVERVGVCGTDVEFFTGEMAYLHQGHSAYPMRPGHEWSGRVAAVGEGVDPRWLGRRVMGDTMLGCGGCRRCRRGHQHVCEKRQEVGIRGARAGALAEQLAVPASSLHALPDSVDAVLGALVEPGGNGVSASPGLDAAIGAYADGSVDPRPLVAATVGLDGVGPVLAGERPPGAGPGPKIHVDPRLGP
jgi:threonine dehydrogenase-like Zn-dependent dehydrogenase